MFNVEFDTTEISVFDVDNFVAKVAQLNVKAAKKGIAPITYTVGETFKYKVPGKHWYDQPFSVEMTVIAVSYPIYKINGWKFIGKIDHKESIVQSAPKCEVPEMYRNSDPVCEHCNTHRDRNETFILFDGSNYKQVGRSCLGLFLGVDSETILTMSDNAMFAKFVNAHDQDDEDLFDDGMMKFKRYFYDLDVYLPFVAQQIRLHGWISRDKAANSFNVPTADRAFDDMLDIKDESKKISEPTEKDRQLAASAVEWAKNLTDFECGEYLRNLRQIAQNGHTSQKMMGYAASMIAAYNKATEPKVTSGEYIGTVGQKITVKVTLTHVSSPIYGTYGTSYINTFVDSANNVICWKTGKAINKGEYTLTAKVKDHNQYKGTNQTWVERASLA